MSRYPNRGKRSYGRKKGKKNSYANCITQLARDLGAIDRGRKNPDSMVSAAYNQGNNSEKRKRKSLF